MKRILLTSFCLLVITGSVLSQEKRKLTSTIDKVTVFIQGAQLERKIPVNLPPGNYEITIPGLTCLLDPATLQTKGTGSIDILSVRTGRVFNEEQVRSEREDSLKTETERLDNRIAILEASLLVLEEERVLLKDNKELPMEGSASWAEKLKETADFYRQRLQDISLEAIRLRNELSRVRRSLEITKKRLTELPDEVPEEKTEVYLEVKVNRSTRDSLSLSYQVAHARWFPEYDFRITDLQSPLNIEYKARISQQTGEDWENVKLVINTGSPNQATRAPEALTWWLRTASPRYHSEVYGYAIGSEVASSGAYSGTVSGKVIDKMGEVLPGVTVMIPGSTIGTVTDIEGKYSLKVPYGTSALSYQFIGLQGVVHAINGSRLDVMMGEDTEQLSEVVVTGISTGASAANSGAINRSPAILSGRAAGVNIAGAGGAIDNDINIVIRGNSSLSPVNISSGE
ncbi:MAG: mucoidy inhibitor MuiA family protein, partial [Cyclobacteriaceae bacterium]